MNPQKTSDPVVPPAAHRYLCELELEVKRIPGCNPEEAISDAREFLLSDYDALVRSAELPDDQSHYDLIVESFGTPKEVANQYKSATVPTPECKTPGYAPGWRICCTKCGRSAPLAAVGGTRIGASRVHKYILGFCHDCKRLRSMRILQDLDQTNLTEMLDANLTTEQLRKNLHANVPKLVLKILLLVFSLQLVIFLVVGGIVLLSLWYSGVLGAGDLHSRTSQLAKIDESTRLNTVSLVTFVQSQEFAKVGEKLEQAVMNNYAYRDRLGIDWKAKFQQFAPQWKNCKNEQEAVDLIVELMSEAKDTHVTVKLNNSIKPTFRADVTWNFNPRVLPKVLKSFKQHGKTVITGMVDDHVRYVLISTFDNREPQSFEAVLNEIREAAKDDAPLIVDVRPNSGGDERLAQQVASYFVTQPTPYAASRTMKDGKLSEELSKRMIQPNQEGQVHTGPRIVLMGKANVSSCESFLRMMKVSGATLVGEPSMGSSGNPKPTDLGHGISIMLPSWQQCDLNGNSLEGVSMAPDVLVNTKPTDFASDDPVLRKAIELIRSSK